MIKIKRITKLLLFSIFVILVLMYINKIQDEKLVMNELKEVYINKNHINNKLREKIEFNIKEEKITKADEYFILGYMSLKEDKDNNLAKKYFNLAIDNIDKNTSEFSKVYSYKFLSDIMIKENNIDKAIEYAEIAFLNIKPNNYNNNCKIVVDIFKQVSKYNEGRKVAIKHVNNIVEKQQILNAQSKTDLYRYLSALYILEQDYTQGVKVNLQVIKLNEKTKDDYYMGKSIVDLSIITRELGGYETSIEILNSIDTSNIDKELLKSDLEIYKLINLAQLQNTIGLYDEALKSANKITKYENDIPYTKREEIICMKNIVIAEIYINKNNIEMSKEYIKKVQDELDKEKSSYIHIEGYYYIALGKLNEKEGELNEAINNFEKAIEIIKEQTNIDNYRSCLGYLINIYNQLNDKENMLKYSDELIKIEQIKNDLISKKYYKYINYEEEYKKIEKDKNNIHKIMSSLFFLILGLVAALSKLVVYPYFELSANSKS